MVRKHRFKLVAFDMDGTLVKEVSSWRKIHEFYGTLELEKKNLVEYVEGKISYIEFMRRDIEAWPKPLHIDDISRILMEIELEPESKEVVEKIKEMDLETAVISAGIDILAETVANILGISHAVANGFELNRDGFLTGEGIMRVDPIKKHEALMKLSQNLGVELKDVIAIGDTEFDKSFLEKAGLGVAVGQDQELLKVADFHITSLKRLPFLVKDLLPT